MTSSVDYQQKMIESFRWRYATKQDSWSGDPGLEASANKLNEYLTEPAMQVLDIGVGTGKPAVKLLEREHKVVGIDLFPNDQWPQLAQQWGDSIELIQTDFHEWPCAAERFDAVMDNGCMHHQHPSLYSAYLNKVNKLLQMDGYLVLNVYAEMDKSKVKGDIKYTDKDRICKYFTVSEISVLLKTKGFTVLTSEYIYRAEVDEYYLLLMAQKINKVSSLELNKNNQEIES